MYCRVLLGLYTFPLKSTFAGSIPRYCEDPYGAGVGGVGGGGGIMTHRDLLERPPECPPQDTSLRVRECSGGSMGDSGSLK